jgi:ATP-dependent Lon protease
MSATEDKKNFESIWDDLTEGNPAEDQTPRPQMSIGGGDKITMELPIMAIKDMVIYPSTFFPLVISHAQTIHLIDDVVSGSRTFAFVAIKPSVGPVSRPDGHLDEIDDTSNGVSESPDVISGIVSIEPEIKPTDLYEYGCRVEIVKMIKFLEDNVRLLLQGMERVKIEGIVERTPYLKAKISVAKETMEQTPELEALMHTASNLFMNIISQLPHLPIEELRLSMMNINSPLTMCYFIASNMNFPIEEKQKILEIDSIKDKLERMIRLLNREVEVLQISGRIQSEVKEEVTKVQREHILREQMRIIQRELGEDDPMKSEVNKLRSQLAEAKLSAEAKKAAEDELNRLSRIHPSSAEYSVSRTYLDWLINLPWNISTEDNLDIDRAAKILDEDHYGLEKVKERILEYLAVRKLKQDMKGPILCFVGPPGVGKTSLGKSIARALGRKFVRFSLGGIRDEAEIRGHRRTYVGALPGRIIQWLRKGGSKNPVFMLDEIDKIGVDFRGDPSSALLEVLDPEQNNSFSDHYLEVSFDLSAVMFITTANIIDTILPALRDRMEVLELPGYIAEEKLKIAQDHLILKQLKEHGLEANELKFEPELIHKIIKDYTREAGVRNLEREIATVCRKVAKHKASQGLYVAFNPPSADNIEDFLGPVKYFSEIAARVPEQGVATGMVWTPIGGDIVFVESTKMKGNNNLILTGHLGDVMKESARAALTFIRSKSKKFKIPEISFKDYDIHIHVPAGAIPKDGPSAGITIAISLISLFINKRVKNNIAMTGEITLSGKILPVGGIKEKVIAARRAGLDTIILPKHNQKDLKEIPEHIRQGLRFELIDTIEDAVKIAIL